MKENKINALTAIIFCAAAIIMLAALSFAIGKWSFGNNGYKITVKFPNATGINPNSEVKCAGAHAGRVVSVNFIPRNERDKDPKTGLTNTIVVVCALDKDIDVGKDVGVTIKQDGFGIAAKYVLLTPGSSTVTPALAEGDVLQGEMPFDLSDLIQPAGEALTQAKELVGQLGPMLDKFDKLSDKLSSDLPPLIDNANTFLVHGNHVMENFDTPEGRKRLNEMLDSLKVSTENLKVVSSNAKALTATLAQKPWRVFWGGPTVPPPSETQVLDSNKVIHLKPEVDVNGTAPTDNPSNKTH